MTSVEKKTSITLVVHDGEQKRIVRPRVVNDTYRDLTRAVDLAFVIDTTGSMSDKIEGLLTTCAGFADEFSKMNLDGRLAVVAFGDLTVRGDTIEHYDFTDDIRGVKQYLKNIPRNGGGGNEGESSLEALQHAMKMEFRPMAVKVLVLITDEPAHQYYLKADDVIDLLRLQEILVFVISSPMKYYKELARRTGGKWYRISASVDFTDVLSVFDEVAQRVSEVVSDVYRLGDGSVTKYLQLKTPQD